MTKAQEQRAAILKKLWWMKKDQEKNLLEAKSQFMMDHAYRCIDVLETTIRTAMEIKPVSFEKRLSTVPGTTRPCFITECNYSDADNAKVAEVIRRMVEQGFIRIRKADGFTMVEVLKTR